MIRTSGDPATVGPALKQTVSHVSGNMVMFGEQTMRDVISGSLSARRFTRLLLGSFAILALLLAAVGIYGVVSYTVTQATQEIGVRMALGADRATVLYAVLQGAMTMAAIGIVVGAVFAFAATRVMKDLLFGVSTTDPLTFAAVALLLGIVTLVASYVPALRATRVDPIVALRYE